MDQERVGKLIVFHRGAGVWVVNRIDIYVDKDSSMKCIKGCMQGSYFEKCDERSSEISEDERIWQKEQENQWVNLGKGGAFLRDGY